MGSAASLQSSSMQRLDAVYQEHKAGSDADLLAALLTVIAELTSLPVAPVVDAVNAFEDTTEALASRNAAFLVACGKFTKSSGSKGNLSQAQALLAGPGSVQLDAVDEDGWTALHHAAGEGHTPTVEFLLRSKASMDVQDPFGCTPLWVAAFNDRRDACKALLVCGANETLVAKPEGEPKTTAALAARRNRHPGLADLLDSETQCRALNIDRLRQQQRGEMDLEEFNLTLRAMLDPALHAKDMAGGGDAGGEGSETTAVE